MDEEVDVLCDGSLLFPDGRSPCQRLVGEKSHDIADPRDGRDKTRGRESELDEALIKEARTSLGIPSIVFGSRNTGFQSKRRCWKGCCGGCGSRG
ncbi:hypothetical protein FKM82_025810 [Ascaphus truei]